MSDKIFATGKDLKVGKYVLIDGVPCKIVSIDVSKPGKHGAAKMRIVGIGLFEGQKKNLLISSDSDVEVPIIERKTVQVIEVAGDSVKVMDSKTYEIYDIALPDEFKDKVSEGVELEIMESMGKRKIERVK